MSAAPGRQAVLPGKPLPRRSLQELVTEALTRRCTVCGKLPSWPCRAPDLVRTGAHVYRFLDLQLTEEESGMVIAAALLEGASRDHLAGAVIPR